MGLKKVHKILRDPGGALVHKATTGTWDRPSSLKYATQPWLNEEKPPGPEPFDPKNRPGSTINGQSGTAQLPIRLGWTNNGRMYANSPFNGANPKYYTSPPNPMSFGGSSMGPSGPQQMQMGPPPPQMAPPLQAPPSGGITPPAGAPPPTSPNNGMVLPEFNQALIAGLRGR